jgi:hypothetical protein
VLERVGLGFSAVIARSIVIVLDDDGLVLRMRPVMMMTVDDHDVGLRRRRVRQSETQRG